MEVSTQDLIYVIGEQTVRIKLLEIELSQAQAMLKAEDDSSEVPNEQEPIDNDR